MTDDEREKEAQRQRDEAQARLSRLANVERSLMAIRPVPPCR